jgi:aminopeptidase
MMYPTQEHLRKKADVIVNFALGRGAGIKPGETVFIRANQLAEPLYTEVCNAVLKAGGNVLPIGYVQSNSTFEGASKDLFELGNDAQIKYYPEAFYKGLFDSIDHLVNIHTPLDLIASVSPLQKRLFAEKLDPYEKEKMIRENDRRLSYTVVLWPTEYMAAGAGVTLEECWDEVIAGCYLDTEDPVSKWRNLQKEIHAKCDILNGLRIDKLHVYGPDVDLWMTLGAYRQFLGLSGRNLPSFEIFTSPDWRGTNGWVRFNMPRFIGGKRVSGIYLKFENGIIVDYSATENYDVLKALIEIPNGNKLGEFAMTDSRYSILTKDIGHLLYTENLPGFHIAIGRSYDQTHSGSSTLTSELRQELGFNECSSHTDLVFTGPFQVDATLADGSIKTLYRERILVI